MSKANEASPANDSERTLSDQLGAAKRNMRSAKDAFLQATRDAMVLLKDRSIPLADRLAFVHDDDTKAFDLCELEWLFDADEVAIIESWDCI